MVCEVYNVVVDHTKKFVIKQCLDSKKHTKKSTNLSATEERAHVLNTAVIG